MALMCDYRRIAQDSPARDGDGGWADPGELQALSFVFMAVGLSEITEANHQEFAFRMAISAVRYGPFWDGWEGYTLKQYAEVTRSYIGMNANVGDEPRAAWLSRIAGPEPYAHNNLASVEEKAASMMRDIVGLADRLYSEISHYDLSLVFDEDINSISDIWRYVRGVLQEADEDVHRGLDARRFVELLQRVVAIPATFSESDYDYDDDDLTARPNRNRRGT